MQIVCLARRPAHRRMRCGQAHLGLPHRTAPVRSRGLVFAAAPRES